MTAEDFAPDEPVAHPHYRPPIGIPAPVAGEDRGWFGTVASVALHVLVVLALLTPLLASDAVRERVLGAGDDGAAGRGGGGNRGAGGPNAWLRVREGLHYVQVAPTPAPAVPKVTPVPTPVPAVVPPVKPPPTPTPTPTPVSPSVPSAPNPQPTTPAAIDPTAAGTGTGTDGSAGNAGSAGTGIGRGGGVGSGVGPGQGSGIGPGRGGDSTGGIYLPTPTETILPPFDAPASVRGIEILVTFDIDEQGRIATVSFPPTRDGGYNRKLRERLASYRFRPGHTADGQPVRAKYQLSIFIS